MKKIRVLIIEDNSLVAEAIARTLQKYSLDVAEIFSSGEDALKYFNDNEVDLVLMDIMLAGAMDGISTAQSMNDIRAVPIIYLTDHVDKNNVDRAKKTFPANYLSKPFNEADLIRAIDIAFSNATASNKPSGKTSVRDDVFVRTNSQQYLRIPYREILYLEAARSYCKVVTDQGEYTLCTSMNRVHESFENADFIRVHRSYVVNSRRITKLDGNVIFLEQKTVDMGKEFRENLMSSLNLIK